LGNLRDHIQQDYWNAIEICFLPYQAVSLLKVTRIFKTFSTQEVQLDPKDGEWLKCWGVEDPVLHGAPPMALKDEPHMRV